MRGLWFFGFCCATLAFTSANPVSTQNEEPVCLVYMTNNLKTAMKNINAHYFGNLTGQPGRVYQEGIVHYAPPSSHYGDKIFDSGIAKLRKARRLVDQAISSRKRRSSGRSPPLKPIDMHFGDMTFTYNRETDEDCEDETAGPHISCTEFKKGNSVTVDITKSLRAMSSIRNFFNNLFDI